jgi:hypothetical protein
MKFYFTDWKDNRKKVSQKEATAMVGTARYNEMIAESKAAYEDDPDTSIEYMVSNGRLSIEF